MRKQFGMAIGGLLVLAAVFAGGFLLGGHASAQAANTPQPSAKGDYCQLYEQTLASKLNVSTSTLEQANLDAVQKTLDQMRVDGRITAIEETQVMQLLQQVGKQPCTSLTPKAVVTYLENDPVVQQQLANAHAALTAAVAAKLGVSPDTLSADLAKGQTIAQLASAQKVHVADVNAAYLSAAQTLLSQAVSGGILTKEQSKYLYDLAAAAVKSGQYPLLELGS